MTKVRFDKGIEANLPTPGMAEDGHLYLSSDNGNMYLGMPNGSLLPLNRSPYYGTCSTASETNSKVVTLDTEVFSLYGGVMITVRFENANTASSPTINVNSTGAIAVKLYGTTAAGNTPAKSWNAGEAVTFVYDGSYWLLVGGGEDNIGHLNTNNTTSQTPRASESFTSDINLHKVSKTGSYNDLNDTPVYALGESVGGPAKKAISIPFGQVDSTSTSTVFTATVDGIDELRDGVCCYLRNGVVTSASGCTLNINGLGAKPIYYTTASATRVTTHYNIAYTWFFVYNSTRVSGGCWDAYWGYDSDSDATGYNVRQYYHGKKPKTILYRYQFLLTCMDGLLLPVNAYSNNTTTTKELTTVSFDIFGEVYYYGTTTTIQANANIGAGMLWSQAAYTLCDLRYSFNTGATLVAGNDVYLVCSPQPDGSVKLAKDPIAFALPNKEDGLLYKRLGKCYDTYRIILEQHKPVYYVKDGIVRLWTNESRKSLIAGTDLEIVPINTPSRLPEGYVELEYIESTGTQYIDTGQNFLFGDEFYFEYLTVENFSTENKGYGSGTNTNNNISGGGRKSASKVQMWACGANIDYTPNLADTVAYGTRYIEKWKISEGLLSTKLTNVFNGFERVGERTSSVFNSSYNSGAHVYLFRDSLAQYAYYSKARIYRTWLKRNNGDYAFDFIPAKRITDEEVGLFDLVSEVFFTNVGTGDFIGGSEITTYTGVDVINFTNETGYITAADLPSLPLSIENGGTGATTAKAAEYNLTPNLETEITSEFSDTGRIPCLVSPSNTTNGRFYGYRTMLKVWNYIKSKISSVLGIGGSDGIPTAPTAAVGTNTTQIASTAFVNSSISSKVDKVTSTDNAVVRFDGTEGDVQNSGVTVDDNNNITTTGNLIVQNIYVKGTTASTSGLNRYISSDTTDNIFFTVGGVAPLVITPTAVRRAQSGTNIENVNLGTSSFPWNNVYAKAFITNGGTSSQFVKGDGTLDSTSYATSASLNNYLPLLGGTMTGAIRRDYDSASDIPVLNILSANQDIWLWRVKDKATGAATATSSVYGFGLKYLGTGEGNNNNLALYSDNQGGTQIKAVEMKQDGTVMFSKSVTAPTAAAGTNTTQVATTAFVQSAISNNSYWANIQTTATATYTTIPEVQKIKINGDSTLTAASTENCEMLYDKTNKCLKFVFN